MGPPSRIPNRFCLMTPSASPPVQRPHDGPSPTKKRRLSQTPSLLGSNARSQSVASASSSSLPRSRSFDPPPSTDHNDEDLHKARRASAARVLDIWSSLATKYARNLDEDDIIDLENRALIKDNGVLRKAFDFDIGHFADEHERAQRLDNDLPIPPADDEPDELDAFADLTNTMDCGSRSDTEDAEDGEEVGLELSPHLKRIAAHRPLDPADKADLAEFLEAEKLRKEQYGDPDEVELEFTLPRERIRPPESSEEPEQCEDEESEGEDGATSALLTGEDEETTDGDGDDAHVEDYEADIHDEEQSTRSKYRRVSTPSFSPEFDVLSLSNGRESMESTVAGGSGSQDDPIICSDSEDELNDWDEDREEDGESENGSATDTADEDDSTSIGDHLQKQVKVVPSPLRNKSPSRSRNVNSRSVEPVRNTEQTPTTSSKLSSKHRSPVLQLQTPPRSTSSGPEQSNGRKSVKSTSAIPKGIKKKPSQILSSSEEDGHAAKASPKRSQVTPTATPRKSRLIPEVYIDTPRANARKISSPSHRKDLDVIQVESSSEDERPIALSLKPSKGKGKERAMVNAETEADSPRPLQHEVKQKATAPKARNSGESPVSPSKQERTPGSLSSSRQKRRRRESSPEATLQEEKRPAPIFSPPPSSSRASSHRVSSSRRVSSGTQSDCAFDLF